MLWKDESTFSQGDTDRSPRVWRAKAGKVLITVHRHIHHPKDAWLVSCAPFFDTKSLASKSADDAKAEAIALVRAEINAALKSLNA